MSHQLNQIMSRLESVRDFGSYFKALCPAHDDRERSLSLSEAEDGKILLKCHAGCSTKRVLQKLGLPMSALFPKTNEDTRAKKRRKIVATYDYTDTFGQLLFQTVRFEPKGFSQRRPDGKGGWVWNLRSVEIVPYRLPEILKADTVFVVEGEKDADRLVSLGLTATTCPMGAGKWRDSWNALFKGKSVTILPDNDEPGKAHAAKIAKNLSLFADVKIVELPGLPPKGDVCDYLDNGGGLEELLGLVAETPEFQHQSNHKPSAPEDTRPIVRVDDGELHLAVAETLQQMRLNGSIYDRGGELVRIAHGRIYTVTINWLVAFLTGLVRYEKFDGRSADYRVKNCPAEIAKAVLESHGIWELPKLRGVITAPIITPTGRIIEHPGFDNQTGLFLDFSDQTWPGIPEKPDDKQVEEAVIRLWHPFRQFPYISPIDCGGIVAATLTAVVRPVLPTAPAFLFGAPTPGSGKTLQAVCLAALAGHNPEVIPRADGEEEMRKRLFASVRQGALVLLFDNISGSLESDTLCSFLTTGCITDRVLGSSKMINSPTNTLCLLTGNNVSIVGDLNRRLVRVEIDPHHECPHQREFDFSPLAYIRENRMSLVRDALIVLKVAMSQEAELFGDYGSFETWSAMVRKAVVWIGQQRWLDVVDPIRSVSNNFLQDPETQKLAALLTAWRNAFGTTGATVPEAIRTAKQIDDALFAALDEIAGERGVINSRRLGRWIEKHVRRIVSGLCFASSGKRMNYNNWTVLDV